MALAQVRQHWKMVQLMIVMLTKKTTKPKKTIISFVALNFLQSVCAAVSLRESKVKIFSGSGLPVVLLLLLPLFNALIMIRWPGGYSRP